jgi:hypothetical protein
MTSEAVYYQFQFTPEAVEDLSEMLRQRGLVVINDNNRITITYAKMRDGEAVKQIIACPYTAIPIP